MRSRSERGGEGPIAHDALEAGNARLVAFEFDNQRRSPRGKFLASEFNGLRGGTLDHVGEADAVRWQQPIMLRFQSFDAKCFPDRLAEHRTGKARPESIDPAREVVALRS